MGETRDSISKREPGRWNQPTQWAHDLNPPHRGDVVGAGRSARSVGTNARREDRTAADIKELHAFLTSFDGDELRGIPVLPVGAPLEHGAVYMNLAASGRDAFQASERQTAGPHDWIIPKARIDYTLWNKLRGLTDPRRTSH